MKQLKKLIIITTLILTVTTTTTSLRQFLPCNNGDIDVEDLF